MNIIHLINMHVLKRLLIKKPTAAQQNIFLNIICNMYTCNNNKKKKTVENTT